MSTFRPRIIMSGRAQSGKDSFAARLVSAHGYTRVAIADLLKQVLVATDPIIMSNTEGGGYYRVSGFHPSNLKENAEGRRLLQALGQAIRDAFGEGVWVYATVQKMQRGGGPFVVTDARYQNEREMLDEGYAYRVHMVRPRNQRLKAGLGAHPSEEQSDWLAGSPGKTIVIVNDGTLEQLEATADALISLLGSEKPERLPVSMLASEWGAR